MGSLLLAADHERSVASLNLCGSLRVLAAVPFQFLLWTRLLLRYLEIIWPLSVVGEKLFINFFFFLKNVWWGARTGVQPSRCCAGTGECWWGRVMHRQTACCKMQRVSGSNLCGCCLLKLTFGLSQHSKREKRFSAGFLMMRLMRKILQQWSLSVLLKYFSLYHFYYYLNFK